MNGYPFSAVVGLEEVKQALLLAAIDPLIGGVLLRGEKGSAKSTLARALASLLPGEAPFVELPVGATEDRVIGTVDLAAVLATGERRFTPGLLAAAHGGVLYVDEVNLLPDHLVDVLLDVAASGVNRVEREGVSHTHPSRFVLVGSMNPEEGDLRPQLLDRFGLAVDVAAPAAPDLRAEAVRRRRAFETDSAGFAGAWRASEEEARARLAGAVPAVVPDDLVGVVARLCASLGAEGLRADLTICRAAAALAGLHGRDETTVADVEAVAGLALAHRRRRGPLEEAGLAQDELASALETAVRGPAPLSESAGAGSPPAPSSESVGAGSPPAPSGDGGVPSAGRPRPAGGLPQWPAGVLPLQGAVPLARPSSSSGRHRPAPADSGRLVGDRPYAGGRVAAGATVRAAVLRRAEDPSGPTVVAGDVREGVFHRPAGALVVLAVDTSGSMGAADRVSAARQAVLGLLTDAYQRRDQVSLVTFAGDRASVVLRPTASVEVARVRLSGLPTGGRTPLAAGLQTALDVAAGAGDRSPVIVVVTDGRATWAEAEADPVAAALAVGREIRRRGIPSAVVDVDVSSVPLGLAGALAGEMGARHIVLPDLEGLAPAVRGLVAGGP